MNLKRISSFSFILVITLFLSGFMMVSDWVLVENKDQGYQISFPQEPTANVQTVKTAAGNVDMYINMLDLSSKGQDVNLIYMSSFAQYPDSIVHSDKKEQIVAFFRETLDGLIGSIDGELLEEKEVKIGQYKGKEVKINFQDGMAVIRIRVYLVENKVYMLQVVTKTENDNNESISKFLNSFSLLDN